MYVSICQCSYFTICVLCTDLFKIFFIFIQNIFVLYLFYARTAADAVFDTALGSSNFRWCWWPSLCLCDEERSSRQNKSTRVVLCPVRHHCTVPVPGLYSLKHCASPHRIWLLNLQSPNSYQHWKPHGRKILWYLQNTLWWRRKTSIISSISCGRWLLLCCVHEQVIAPCPSTGQWGAACPGQGWSGGHWWLGQGLGRIATLKVNTLQPSQWPSPSTVT